MAEKVDHLVIGGGAYGTYVASTLAEAFPKDHVVLAEQEDGLSKRASINNHGRLHFGYQYPLHPATAAQSRINVTRFLEDFSDCIDHESIAHYGIHRDSRISADDYENFCQQTNLAYERTSRDPHGAFGTDVISSFQVPELTFSSSDLRVHMGALALDTGVDIRTNLRVERIQTERNGIGAITDNGEELSAQNVFNCTYSGINNIHAQSNLPLIPSTHERYSLFQVTMPEELRGVSATVIYGPFASIVANQSNGTHVMAHVTHSNCEKSTNMGSKPVAPDDEFSIRYANAVADAQRFLPGLEEATHNGNIVEVKSVFGLDPTDGERRALTFTNHGGMEGYHVIFGGKMNSFYDAGEFALQAIGRSARMAS